MMKKYNVEELKKVSGGNEFGWPNGWDFTEKKPVGWPNGWDFTEKKPVGWPNGWD